MLFPILFILTTIIFACSAEPIKTEEEKRGYSDSTEQTINEEFKNTEVNKLVKDLLVSTQFLVSSKKKDEFVLNFKKNNLKEKCLFFALPKLPEMQTEGSEIIYATLRKAKSYVGDNRFIRSTKEIKSISLDPRSDIKSQEDYKLNCH
jgi:hypothetical protein